MEMIMQSNLKHSKFTGKKANIGNTRSCENSTNKCKQILFMVIPKRRTGKLLMSQTRGEMGNCCF